MTSTPRVIKDTTRERSMPQSVRRHAVRYVLLRLTGAFLAVLVCGHFLVVHFITDVADTNASFIAVRWGQVLWVIWDSVMLAAALLHGVIGMTIAVSDYTSGRRRRIVSAGLVGLTVLLFVYGAIVIGMGATV